MSQYKSQLSKLTNHGEFLGANIFFTPFCYIPSKVEVPQDKKKKTKKYKIAYIDALNCYFSFNKCIVIDSKISYEFRLYALIHEMGHYLQDMQNGFERSKNHISAQTKNICINKAFKANKIKDEFLNHETEAWEYGEEIAKVLNIKLNKNFKKYKNNHLKNSGSIKVSEENPYD